MITSIKEHNERHLKLEGAIVVFKVVFNLLLHSTQVIDLAVAASLYINSVHEVTENDSFRVVDIFLSQAKFSLSLFHEKIVHVFTIRVVIQTITEDTLVLVDPKAEQLDIRLDSLVVHDNTAAKDLRDISQIESVVTLVRSWLQRTIQNLIVNFELALNQIVNRFSDFGVEVVIESSNNGLVDSCDSLKLHVSVSQDVKLTLHTLSDFRSTTTWRSHSGDKDDINKFVERLLL